MSRTRSLHSCAILGTSTYSFRSGRSARVRAAWRRRNRWHGPPVAQTREHLIRQLWGSNFFGDRKTVDMHVRWLREKFERYERLPFRITTVYGVGYCLDGVEE